MNCLKHIIIAIFILNLSNTDQAMAQTANDGISAGRVIQDLKTHSGVHWSDQTVDEFKTGDPVTSVTGIAVCFTATMEVLQQAVDKGCNLIITHEPTFYNHLDETKDLSGNTVYEDKRKFIDDHGLVIFRFHDHIHRMQPDGIEAGMIRKMHLPDPEEGFPSPVFHIGETTVEEYVDYLSELFNTHSIRYIGNPGMIFSTMSLVVGAPSSSSQIRMLEDPAVDVVVTGEAREWETVEYARDAVQQGRKKALIILGHANSEEAGMIWCADWMRDFITEVPVYFIAAGEPFEE